MIPDVDPADRTPDQQADIDRAPEDPTALTLEQVEELERRSGDL